MALSRRPLAALLALALAAPARAEPPAPPPDPEQGRRLAREALAQYGLGVLQRRQDRLAAAARSLEQAVRLDPEAVPPRLALVPLYNALGRPNDAAAAAAAVLLLDPSQADTWRALAGLLHEMKRTPEAVSVLSRCVATPELADCPADLIAARRDLAGLLTALGAHAKAADSYRKALDLLAEHRAALAARGAAAADLDRERAELHEGLARASLAAGQFADARTAAELARDGFRKGGDAARAERLAPTLAAAVAGLGDPAGASRLLDDYLSQKPRDFDAFILKAKLLRDVGAGHTVPAVLAGYAQADPDFLPLRVLLGDEYRRLGRRAQAEQVYRSVIERQADVAAYRGLFAVLAGPGGSPMRLVNVIDEACRQASPPQDPAGNKPEADEAAQKARAAAREHTRAIAAALGQEPAAAGLVLSTVAAEMRPGRGPRLNLAYETWLLLAGVAERAHQLTAAEDLFRAALYGARRDQQAGVYAALIRVLWAGHKRAEIVALCEQGLAGRGQATSRVLFHFHLALALAQLGRVEDGLKHADEAVRLASGRDVLAMHLRRVYVLTWAERYDEAEAACQKLLDEFPQPDDERKIRHALANVYSGARRFDRAEEQLRAVLELDPGDAGAHNDLGYQLADLGRQLDEAERLVRRALELDRVKRGERLEDDGGENAAYLDSLGWVLFRRGRLAEARALLERAAGLPEGAVDPIVWDHLGDASARLDRPREAAEAWARARALYRTERRSLHDPRGAEVERKLGRLKLTNP